MSNTKPIRIKLDIENIHNTLYAALLTAFHNEAIARGLDPDAYVFGEWLVSCKAEAVDPAALRDDDWLYS